MNKKKIFIAGHNGMVGNAVLKKFINKKQYKIIIINKKELNLLDQNKVYKYLYKNQFHSVIICAARAGGIYANNTFKTNFIFENLQIQNNLIYGSHLSNVKKLIFLGSSCIYPKKSRQPMREEDLLSGYLEPTNEPYAIAKIAGIKLCEAINFQYKKDFRSLMPTNLYGVRDNFDLKNSHVIPALIRKFHEAKINKKKVTVVWGSGKIFRDFLYVDDLAEAILKVYELPKKKYINLTKGLGHINIGSGKQITIAEIANKIKNIINFEGEIFFDKTKPDGMKLKMLCNKRINKTGWRPQTKLALGLKKTYNYYKSLLKNNYEN